MSERWSDLAVRMGSGALMVVVGILAIWLGGDVFHVVVALICGLMIWELTRMFAPDAPGLAVQLGGVAALAVLMAIYLPVIYAAPLLVAPAFVGASQLKVHRLLFGAFTVMVLAASYGMMHVRDDLGFAWLVWLVLIVVVTDVAGYFAGRMLGGPKFWPKVSPKKTWSGTAAGWIGAAIVGAIFAINSGVWGAVMLASIVLSFSSQMGDIAESAIKRKMGVKDSSHLIPGHGGVLDRFDGMLGASVAFLMIEFLFGFPWLAL
ncbi:phosphatidate cytidylyltransferase [uncultured Tateyamaria sp.]|uniref:phosphatidate cytidylyltransferase n=1 Tax=uncultured Tateyamaria sp. TaxID=455651 RepID=UPI00263848E0|nr:phosphatidate cytidylyltransferase [uncultured Tateyamaria sp.]